MWMTALIMGLAGSLHCVGMCSPLAMAVTSSRSGASLKRLVYNAGRIFTYSILGMIVASLGFVIPIFKFQNLVSIVLGIILLLVGIGTLKAKIPYLSTFIGIQTTRLKILFAKFLQRKGLSSVLFLGSLNGLLPCGLVYIALAYCLTLQSPLEGFGFMSLFGVGTLPAMLGLTSLLQQLVKRFNLSLKHVTSGMMILAGILLIARVFIVHLPHKASLQEGVIDIVLCR
jgi:sulfite exporter TauE/SafE